MTTEEFVHLRLNIRLFAKHGVPVNIGKSLRIIPTSEEHDTHTAEGCSGDIFGNEIEGVRQTDIDLLYRYISTFIVK